MLINHKVYAIDCHIVEHVKFKNSTLECKNYEQYIIKYLCISEHAINSRVQKAK